MFFIGIDEAGYGPILGPLVIGGVMLRCPCEPTPRYLWKQMPRVIASKPRAKESRLVVCDSKMLSNRPDGLVLLEKAGLVAANLAGLPADDCMSLLTCLDLRVGPYLADCPWDGDGDLPLPHACPRDSLTVQTSAVRAASQRAGCTIEAIAATILPPARYNELVQRTDNKAVVLWSATTWVLNRLLQRAAAIDPAEPVLAVLDRQGGRSDYRPALQRSFEPLELAEEHRREASSRYRMVLPLSAEMSGESNSNSQTVDLTFMVDADLKCCVTAWGSIIAKYTREICMVRLNNWWRARVDDLAPTAGYLPDGRRFAEQVTPHLARLNVPPDMLIRER